MTLTYHNDPERKAAAVCLAQGHRALDLLRAGSYVGPDGTGCSVGCFALDLGVAGAVHGNHAGVAAALGLPVWLVRVQDQMFERLPAPERYDWHVSLMESVPVGVDVGRVRDGWLLWLLTDKEHGVRRHTRAGSRPRKVVEDVAALLRRQISGETITPELWRDARAVAAAAYAAVGAHAAIAAAAIAAAAIAAAAIAAIAAIAAADAADAARLTHYRASSQALLRLLREAA